MTVIVIAMLGTVIIASAVLAVVSVAHELTRSARGRRWLRRKRGAVRRSVGTARELTAHGMRVARREIADQLSAPATEPANRADDLHRPAPAPVSP